MDVYNVHGGSETVKPPKDGTSEIWQITKTRRWFQIFSIFTPTWGRFPFRRLKPPTRRCLFFIVSQGELPKHAQHQANWVRLILMFVVCQDSSFPTG